MCSSLLIVSDIPLRLYLFLQICQQDTMQNSREGAEITHNNESLLSLQEA